MASRELSRRGDVTTAAMTHARDPHGEFHRMGTGAAKTYIEGKRRN